MRRLMGLSVSVLILAAGSTSQATLISMTGALSVTIGVLDPAVIPSVPGAMANLTTTAGGNAIQSLTLPEALAKALLRFALHRRTRAIVSLHGPNPVVQTILKVTHTAMRIPLIPTRKQNGLLVGHIVAVCVFQIQRSRSVLHNHATAMEGDAGRNTELFGR